jgi:hypothetical protein
MDGQDPHPCDRPNCHHHVARTAERDECQCHCPADGDHDEPQSIPKPIYLTGRPTPPPLIYQNPVCPLCLEQVKHSGDAWGCYTCQAWWPDGEGAIGDWNDEDEIQCASTGRPVAAPDEPPTRCLLGETHIDNEDEAIRKHKSANMHWDEDPYAIVVEVGQALSIEDRDARDYPPESGTGAGS